MRTENVEKFVKIGTKQRRPNTFRLFKIPTKQECYFYCQETGADKGVGA